MREWIKALFILWIVLFCASIFCAYATAAGPRESLVQDLRELKAQMPAFKETAENKIVEECQVLDTFWGDATYCVLSRLYAMNHVVRYYNQIFDDFMWMARPVSDIATDFEALNCYMETHSHLGSPATYIDFVTVLRGYERYLEGKEVPTCPSNVTSIMK